MAKLLVNYDNLSDKEKKEYQKSLKLLYILLGVATVLFYLIPYLFIFTGGLRTLLIYLTLLNVYTAFCFIAGLLHGAKYGFGIFVPAALGIFFIPTTIIFYNNISLSGWALLYFILGLFGEFTGNLMLKRKQKKKQPIGLNRLINGKQTKTDSKGRNKKSTK